jgi:uncharacterized protein YbaR (Trm112 family)
MDLDPFLLEILACPCEHHAPVEPVDDDAAVGGPALVCTRCRSSFPVRDGIPVMLLDEAVPGPAGIGNEPSGGAGAAPGA